MRIGIQLDPADKILLKRKMDPSGKGQKFFTHEVRRLSDAYVPMRSGVLKNTAVEYPKRIEYVQPYARRQYWENIGNAHLRGKQWDKRMWADRGKEIVESVANYVGGKAK